MVMDGNVDGNMVRDGNIDGNMVMDGNIVICDLVTIYLMLPSIPCYHLTHVTIYPMLPSLLSSIITSSALNVTIKMVTWSWMVT